jgi:hypothetical protein
LHKLSQMRFPGCLLPEPAPSRQSSSQAFRRNTTGGTIAARTRQLAAEDMLCYTDGMARKRNPPKKPPVKAPTSRRKAGRQGAAEHHLDRLYHQVREILAAARNRAWQAVNSVMVEAYWDVGRVIVEEEQAGRQKADYGKRVIEGLARRLRDEFGKGYDRSNLFHMRAFFLSYPKVDALRRQLSVVDIPD